jgi:hypothetical protein
VGAEPWVGRDLRSTLGWLLLAIPSRHSPLSFAGPPLVVIAAIGVGLWLLRVVP